MLFFFRNVCFLIQNEYFNMNLNEIFRIRRNEIFFKCFCFCFFIVVDFFDSFERAYSTLKYYVFWSDRIFENQ